MALVEAGAALTPDNLSKTEDLCTPLSAAFSAHQLDKKGGGSGSGAKSSPPLEGSADPQRKKSRARPSSRVLHRDVVRSTKSLDKFLLGASAVTFDENTCPNPRQASDKTTPPKASKTPLKISESALKASAKAPSKAPETAPKTSAKRGRPRPQSQSLAPRPACGRPKQLPALVLNPIDKENTPPLQNVNSAADSAKDSAKVSPREAARVSPDSTKRSAKRKRSLFKLPLEPNLQSQLLHQFQAEIESLVRYYHEEGVLHLNEEALNGVLSQKSEIACLLEESSLAFSSLVDYIFGKLQNRADSNVTLASVRSSILSIGQRVHYGITKPDADVLEDCSDACLWCWEVRDVKLLPENQRHLVAIRRRCRKKISERITALSAIIEVIGSNHSAETEQVLLAKSEEALAKTDDESSIRAAVAAWLQRGGVKQVVKEAKVKEKAVLKEQQKLEQEQEKEQRRLEKEAEKKRLKEEKEKERLEKEASKEQARSLKEAARFEKEVKRQQEEAEKEAKRREREVAASRKQSALQKQASLLGRFLHKEQSPAAVATFDIESNTPDRSQGDQACEERTEQMDRELGSMHDRAVEDLFSSHVTFWRNNKPRKVQHWGSRRLSKGDLPKPLRSQGHEANLTESRSRAGTVQDSVGHHKSSRQDMEDDCSKVCLEWDETDCPAMNNYFHQSVRSTEECKDLPPTKRRKLLQFDGSHRPAYYGTYSKKSTNVASRTPLNKDSTLDYEVDSDEEWEEEDPGESLSDCDKDDEEDKEDKVEVEDDDESGDGFVVPDGYLSDSEGVHLDDLESEDDVELSRNEVTNMESSAGKLRQDASQDSQLLFKQQKILDNITGQALKCNRAYVVVASNTNRVDSGGKIDYHCLQALRMRAIAKIDIVQPPPDECTDDVDRVPPKRLKKCTSAVTFSEPILKEMVEVILVSSFGLKKMADVLSEKFPSISRSKLKAKIREIADFVDNQWQVKTEIGERLGVRIPPRSQPKSPEVVNVEAVKKTAPNQKHVEAVKKTAPNQKPIVKFFSKQQQQQQQNMPCEEAITMQG